MKQLNNEKSPKPENTNNFMTSRRHILGPNSGFAVREAYKTLRTNTSFFLSDNACKKFCITSSTLGEGKSITMLNLAISFAEAGQKVLLIDADMRRPALARLLIEKATPGLSNVLAGITSAQESIRRDIYPNLDILFSGDIPPNPSELLGNDRMRQLIEEMSLLYDYILVDTPPVNAVSDTCIVANMLDGVLYLVRQNKAEKEAVRAGVNQLELVGAKLLGFVLNGVDMESRKRYYITEYK